MTFLLAYSMLIACLVAIVLVHWYAPVEPTTEDGGSGRELEEMTDSMEQPPSERANIDTEVPPIK